MNKLWTPGMSLADYAALWEDMEPHWGQLVGLAMKCKNGTIIECGVRGGVSTWAFLKGLGPQGQLHSVDIDRNVRGMVPADVAEDPRWNLTIGDSKEYLAKVAPKADLVFIDTSHTYLDTAQELWLAMHLAPTIVLHDYLAEDYPGVAKAVHERMRQMRTTNGEPVLTVMPSQWGLAILTR